MSNRKIDQIKRKLSRKRIFLILLSFVVISSSGIFWSDAEAVVVESGPKLTKVGPTSGGNGFPVWYKDSSGTRLELCLDAGDPYCGIVPEDFDPSLPISFPDNYPGEAFYQLASTQMEAANGRDSALATFALEATFNGGVPVVDDQIVFGRIRFRFEALTPNTEYTITHPYGKDKIKTDAEGEINYTEDIGISGGFAGALTSRIGTFLKWDQGAPAGYIGDPNVDHKVTGGVNNQNFFRIEGPGIGLGNYSGNACSTNSDNCIQTDLFSLAGKIATNAGVAIQQATYNRTTAENGTIDIFASSEESAQSIEVKGDNIAPTLMNGENGQYFARVDYSGQLPNTITVTNVGDEPDAVKTITPVDRITATANYDINTKTITVTAESSDKLEPKPVLSVTGFGVIPANGTLIIPEKSYTPPSVTITSSKKGTVTIPVNINGNSLPPIPVVAFAGADQSVTAGDQAQITLDASNSSGPIETFSWKQLSGPVTNISITDADKAIAKFDTPSTPGEYVFQLTVTGRGTEPSSSTVKVTILEQGTDPVPDFKANAGPDQSSVKQGTLVTLDGSLSENAKTYSWKQISGPVVTLNSANTNKPTFTFPKRPESITFELTATGPGGKTAKDTVVISPAPDTLTVTSAEFRNRDSDWRIDGTSNIFGPGVKITLTIIDSANPKGVKLGTADVDPLGNWRFRSTGLPIQSSGTLLVESSSGGKLTNVPVRVRAK